MPYQPAGEKSHGISMYLLGLLPGEPNLLEFVHDAKKQF